jgi:hypothetical protein
MEFGSHPTPTPLLPGAFTRLVKQWEPGDNHSLPSEFLVKNAWSYTSITSYVFILLHRYKSAFNISTVSLISNSTCFFLSTHSNPVIFSHKLKASFLTEGNVGSGCKLE